MSNSGYLAKSHKFTPHDLAGVQEAQRAPARATRRRRGQRVAAAAGIRRASTAERGR